MRLVAWLFATAVHGRLVSLPVLGGFTIIRSVNHYFKGANLTNGMCIVQVSKTAPTGEYLTTGSFMIRGITYYCNGSVMQGLICR